MSSCELSSMSAKKVTSGPLEEKQMFLIAEPSPQCQTLGFFCLPWRVYNVWHIKVGQDQFPPPASWLSEVAHHREWIPKGQRDLVLSKCCLLTVLHSEGIEEAQAAIE